MQCERLQAPKKQPGGEEGGSAASWLGSASLLPKQADLDGHAQPAQPSPRVGVAGQPAGVPGPPGPPPNVARPYLCDASTQTAPSKTCRDAATQADLPYFDEPSAEEEQRMRNDCFVEFLRHYAARVDGHSSSQPSAEVEQQMHDDGEELHSDAFVEFLRHYAARVDGHSSSQPSAARVEISAEDIARVKQQIYDDVQELRKMKNARRKKTKAKAADVMMRNSAPNSDAFAELLLHFATRVDGLHSSLPA